MIRYGFSCVSVQENDKGKIQLFVVGHRILEADNAGRACIEIDEPDPVGFRLCEDPGVRAVVCISPRG